jgi:hypothetical protein
MAAVMMSPTLIVHQGHGRARGTSGMIKDAMDEEGVRLRVHRQAIRAIVGSAETTMAGEGIVGERKKGQSGKGSDQQVAVSKKNQCV